MTITWTVLESFWSIEEAQIARGLLESEGIACQLENLAVAGNFWHLNNATGGIKLLVESDKLELASQLLSEAEEAHRQREAMGDVEVDDDEFADEADSTTEVSAQDVDGAEWGSDDVEAHHGLFDKMRIGRQIILLTLLLPVVIMILAGVVGMLLSLIG